MRRYVPATLVALALGLAACSGDDDDSSEEPPGGTSKAEFIEKGDAICARVNESIVRINQEAQQLSGSREEQFAALAPILRRATEIQADAIEEFRALEPPEADQKRIDRYLEAAEEQADVLEQMAAAAENADAAAFSEASPQLTEISLRRKQLISGYGFEECGGNAAG